MMTKNLKIFVSLRTTELRRTMFILFSYTTCIIAACLGVKYKAGQLLSGEVKAIAIDVLTRVIQQHQVGLKHLRKYFRSRLLTLLCYVI